MNGMNEAILAVAQAQQGDAIPVDIPPMTQSAPDMGKPPVTPKMRAALAHGAADIGGL